MQHRIAVAGLVAAVLIAGACADQDGASSLATEPEGLNQAVSYATTGSGSYVDPRTHRLVPIKEEAGTNSRIKASIVAGSGNGGALKVDASEPGVARTGGSAIHTFVDDGNHKHAIVLLYASTGGPPAAMQHYVDGKLVSTTAYTWGKTSTGWVRTRSMMQAVRNGTLYGTYTTNTSSSTPGGGGDGGGSKEMLRLDHPAPMSPLQRGFNSVVYGLAFAFAPQDANAQLGKAFALCRQEWLRYIAAAAILSGAAATMAAAPALTPIILSAFLAALASTAAAEDSLLDCILFQQGYSDAGLGQGGMGSGAGGTPAGNKDCLAGSYAAHCTTAFTV